MVNISEFKEKVVFKILNETIFLSKSIDEVEGLLKYWNLKQENIFAVRSSKEMKKKYKNIYVYETFSKQREFSTSNFFKKYLFTSGLFDKLREPVFSKNFNFWLFRTYEWCKDLEQIGNNKVLTIDYDLSIKLNNKIQFLKFFNRNDFLSQYLKKRLKKLHTRYEFKTNSVFFKLQDLNYTLPWIVSSQTSSGGDGVFKITNYDDFKNAILKINNPVIKIEKYIEGVPVNQSAIVFHDKIIKYQPSLQIIEENNGEMRFRGSDFKLNISDKSKKEMTKLTHYIGLELIKLGYKGAFGCDFIIVDDDVYFIELNPRFQGSSFLLTYNNEVFNPYIMHILSFHYNEDIVRFKNSINFCENEYITLKNDFHKYQYFFTQEEIQNHKNENIRIPLDNVKIEPNVPLGFFLE